MGGSSHGVKAKKHLGQHFLNDLPTAQRIADSIKGEALAGRILEIGPGTGVLTQFLVPRFGPRLLAMDVDTESIAFLQGAPWIGHTQIVEADFLKFPFNQLPGNGELIITGNFPYNISSQILFKLLDWRETVVELTGMFQKEVAERVCASHGSKTYGILSVLIQHYYHAEYLFTVPPHVFIPPPKVQSGVLRLTRKADLPSDVDFSHLKHVTKAAFNQRRKTLRNALKSGGYDVTLVPEALLGLRAEQLSPDQFVGLALALGGRSA